VPSRRRSEPAPLEIRRFTPAEAERAVTRLKSRMSEVRALAEPKPVHRKDPKVENAEKRIKSTILEVFGENSPEYRDHQYHHITAGRPIRAVGYGEDPRQYDRERQQDFEEGLPRTMSMLESLIQTVEERTDADPTMVETPGADRPAKDTNKVFVVHGRREGPRQAVARFIDQLGYIPIILQEQASEGRTVIEKFERHSEDVAFAVVLLTGDDRGGLAEAEPATYLPRARQNVILELGYFIGALGRRLACVLHEPGVEIPSDFHGVVYVPLDDGGAWRLLLAKEMKAAGLDIDLNRAL
jgi:predicted nucleotide-binding protein